MRKAFDFSPNAAIKVFVYFLEKNVPLWPFHIYHRYKIGARFKSQIWIRVEPAKRPKTWGELAGFVLWQLTAIFPSEHNLKIQFHHISSRLWRNFSVNKTWLHWYNSCCTLPTHLPGVHLMKLQFRNEAPIYKQSHKQRSHHLPCKDLERNLEPYSYLKLYLLAWIWPKNDPFFSGTALT